MPFVLVTDPTMSSSSYSNHSNTANSDSENYCYNTPDRRIRVNPMMSPPPAPRKERGVINFLDCEMLPSMNSPSCSSRLLVPSLPVLNHPPMTPSPQWVSPSTMLLPRIYQQRKQQEQEGVKLEVSPMIRARLFSRQESIVVPPQEQESRDVPTPLPSWLMMEDEQHQQRQEPQDLPMLDLDDLFREAENMDQNQKDNTVNFTATLLPRLSLAAPKARGAPCA